MKKKKENDASPNSSKVAIDPKNLMKLIHFLFKNRSRVKQNQLKYISKFSKEPKSLLRSTKPLHLVWLLFQLETNQSHQIMVFNFVLACNEPISTQWRTLFSLSKSRKKSTSSSFIVYYVILVIKCRCSLFHINSPIHSSNFNTG